MSECSTSLGPFLLIRVAFSENKSKLGLPHHSSIPSPFFTFFIAHVNTQYCVVQLLSICLFSVPQENEAHSHILLAQYSCTINIC